MSYELPSLGKPKPLPPRKKFRLWPFALLGILVGICVALFITRPAPPLTLSFLHGVAPISVTHPLSGEGDPDTDQIWEIPGTLDQIKVQAQNALPASEGWQPPTQLAVGPPNYQFVRVRIPNGDFQFSRVVLRQIAPNKVEVELVQGPIQRNALRN